MLSDFFPVLAVKNQCFGKPFLLFFQVMAKKSQGEENQTQENLSKYKVQVKKSKMKLLKKNLSVEVKIINNYSIK